MSQIFPVLISIVGLFFLANSLIFVHELGHFWIARLTGVTAKRFSLGFGPRVAEWTDRRGTAWSFSMLPMGGYVSFPGEHDAKAEGGYLSRPPAARMAIIAAGPLANILVAIAIYAGIFMIQGMPVFTPIASSVLPGSPAARAGFQPGDRIVAVDNTQIATFDSLRPILEGNPGRTMDFRVARHGEIFDLDATLDIKAAGDREVGYLGIWSNVATRQKMGPITAVPNRVRKNVAGDDANLPGNWPRTYHRPRDRQFSRHYRCSPSGRPSRPGRRRHAPDLDGRVVDQPGPHEPPADPGFSTAARFCSASLNGYAAGRRPERLQDFATRGGVALIMALFLYTTLHDLAGLGLFSWVAGIANASTGAHIDLN